MITYVNGQYVPHERAVVSVDDRGLIFGDAVFDIARTFGGVPFKLDAHLERLGRSMRYVEFDADALLPTIRAASLELVSLNAEVITSVGDVQVLQIVTRGPNLPAGTDPNAAHPTVIVMLRPIAFSSFANFYDSGVDLHVSLLTHHFGGPVDPRAKAANRLANSRAELKGQRAAKHGRGHWTVIFNQDGTIAETHAGNLAVVVGDRLLIPPMYQVLGGISLDTLCDLSRDIGLSVEERPLTAYDVINADETILTATSFSLLPVVSLDGIPLNEGRQVYSQLLERWIKLVGFDFVRQAQDRHRSAVATHHAGTPQRVAELSQP
jgi:branched-chain amino acid aminotransferase